MPSIKADSLPGDGLRRLAHVLLRKLHHDLHAAAGGTHSGIHRARKQLKFMRSFLRLVREAIGDNSFKTDNLLLREAANRLASARRASAMIEAVAKMSYLTDGCLPALRQAAQADHDSQMGRNALSTEVTEALKLVEQVQRNSADWRLPRRDLWLYVKAMRRSYSSARKFLKLGWECGEVHLLHEARKSVIHQLHHLEIIRPAWPEILRPWQKQLQVLREFLGDLNDLEDMEALLDDQSSAFSRLEDKEAVHALFVKRRGDLVEGALPLAKKLYSETPETFALRINAIWETIIPPREP